jgi:hypothetical protein
MQVATHGREQPLWESTKHFRRDGTGREETELDCNARPPPQPICPLTCATVSSFPSPASNTKPTLPPPLWASSVLPTRLHHPKPKAWSAASGKVWEAETSPRAKPQRLCLFAPRLA